MYTKNKRWFGLFLLMTGYAVSANEPGWYIGAGMGGAAANFQAGQFDDGSIGDGVVDNSDSVWMIVSGYEFSQKLALEVGYSDLHNDLDSKTTFSGISDGTGNRFDSLPGSPVSEDIHGIRALSVAAVGSLPIASHFALNAKTGVMFWKAQRTTIDLNRRDDALNGTGVLLGVGAAYSFYSRIVVRADIQRYFNVATTEHNVTALSVLLRF